MPNAVICLSGGIDSSTTLAVCKDLGFNAYAVSFSYGQRQHVELDAAVRIAQSLGVIEHRILTLDLGQLGGSALTDTRIDVPKDRSAAHMGEDMPITYVPARNTIFLSYALAYAEVTGSTDIFIGANAVDYSGYPDCRPDYIACFEKLANLATCIGLATHAMRIHAPLINDSKAEIIRRATKLGVDLSLTHSCYDPQGDLACGHCDSCLLRSAGFRDAGIVDPTQYA
jgi:7-cyano-7-deazaguanine synthase